MYEHSKRILALSQKAYFKKKPPRFISFTSYLPYGKYKGKKAADIAKADAHYLLEYFFKSTKLTIDPAFKNYVENIYHAPNH